MLLIKKEYSGWKEVQDEYYEKYKTNLVPMSCEEIICFFEDEPTDDYEESLQAVAKKYWSSLDFIIEFMMPDLQQVYGNVDAEMVKEKLGRPTIDTDNGRVDYCEQSFDDMHIFSFEFLDDAFKDLQYFSIDG